MEYWIFIMFKHVMIDVYSFQIVYPTKYVMTDSRHLLIRDHSGTEQRSKKYDIYPENEPKA